MVYKKSYRISKGSYRSMKRRRYNKKRVMRRAPKYDGVLKLKCFETKAISFLTQNGNANFTVFWGSNQTTANNSYSRINDNYEFNTWIPKYEQWKMVGVKIKYMPIYNSTGATNTNITQLEFGSSLTTTLDALVSANTLHGLCDYHQLDPQKPWSRYIAVHKVFEHEGADWLNTGTYYSGATSLLRMHCNGYTNDTQIGSVSITYYVKLKGYRYP